MIAGADQSPPLTSEEQKAWRTTCSRIAAVRRRMAAIAARAPPVPTRHQMPHEDRSIDETLDLCWDLMQNISTKYLVRLDQKWIDKYHPSEKK